MTWSDFYLFCFAVGFFFSLVQMLLGHVPGGHDWHLHAPHGGGHGHLHAGHHHAGLQKGGSHTDKPGAVVSPINPGTIAVFLAWFGGTGYLATRLYALWIVATLLLSAAAGLAGASVVFWFLSRVLMREREELDPADYEMVGVLGTVSCNIRPQGLGEILFSQAGSRRAAAARSEDAHAIAPGTEVIVTRFENGIAYVRRWDELAGATDAIEERPSGDGR
jgi:membrane protein implicated in regulation of membrane protease activity